jgi:hypothetical protein
MIESILVWSLIIGFIILSAYIVGGDNRNTKAHKDLQETILNRNEDI